MSRDQRKILIKKGEMKSDFLQVKNDDWINAANGVGRNITALKLYLFLASHRDGIVWNLNLKYVKDLFSVSDKTVYDALDLLERLGYIVHQDGNNYMFLPCGKGNENIIEEKPCGKPQENMKKHEVKVMESSCGKGDENNTMKESCGKSYDNFNF